MHRFTIVDGDGDRRSHRLASGESVTLGKSADCGIIIDNAYLSRRHACLTADDTTLIFEDLDSTNGSWHGDERLVSQKSLETSDTLCLGRDVVLTVDEITQSTGQRHASPEVATEHRAQHKADEDRDVALKQEVQGKILEFLDLRKRDTLDQLSHDELRTETRKAAQTLFDTGEVNLPASVDRERLVEEVISEAIGFGPIEPFLDDDAVTEVMVNGPNQIYVESGGKLQRVSTRFSSDAAVMNVIERIVTPLGRRIDEGSPMIDARLPDGSRVNAIIPPLALAGPTLTIRKFARNRLRMDELVRSGTLSREMADFLEICVKYRRNMVVSGGTGSGKTTTLNILSDFIPDSERIVTIEDSAELQLAQSHVVSLEGRPANIEGKGGVSIRDLVRNSLRMRPDRIVVGECRSGEAIDMLQAMNTGHDGSLTTAHANSPRDVLSRLETMVLMSGLDLPSRAIREQIGSAVEIICQQMRMSDGKRRITSIVEVGTMEGDVIGLQEIFRFRQRGMDSDGNVLGEHEGCGYAPSFYTSLKECGLELDWDIFRQNEE